MRNMRCYYVAVPSKLRMLRDDWEHRCPQSGRGASHSREGTMEVASWGPTVGFVWCRRAKAEASERRH